MDLERLLGWAIMLAVPALFLWRMKTQLTQLQYGKRRAVVWLSLPFRKVRVKVRGVGALLYTLIETAGITAICFFTLHVGYVIMMPYGLENTQYGLMGIAISVVVVDVALMILHWLRIGERSARPMTAAVWVSLMTALLVVGAAAIVFSEGKLLDLLHPREVNKWFGGVIVLAGAFIISLFVVRLQIRSTRLI